MRVNRHVALLRGINVGGKNLLPMKDLVVMFESAGCGDVATYIQSGNVVFSATAALAKKLPTTIEAELTKRFGHRVPLVMRSAAEISAAIASNPFAKDDSDTAQLHLAFLAAAPNAAQIASLDPKRSPPDEFAVIGRDLYLKLPNGVGKTKFTNAYFDGKLATTSTVRNWRTVNTLLDMLT